MIPDPELAAWRRGERERLIALRLKVPVEERARAAAEIARALKPLARRGMVMSFYWPMKGELDFRGFAGELHAEGVRLALPVVVEKRAPMVFRPWEPGAPMERGIWNIPQPATDATVVPDLALAPVVGFSEDCYRLGYGGGYFDRTLAALDPRPLTVGVGLEFQRIDTIHPRPHDIRLDAIVTEERLRSTATSLPRP